MQAMVDRCKRWFKFRFAVLYPMGIYLALYSKIDEKAMLPGIGLIMVGISIRLWANCYAIKMDRLTTSGPYAFVRNPLYLGTAIIMVGIVVLLKIYLLGLICFVAVGIAYYRTILSEQRMLMEKFGNDFLDYMNNVPALFPRLGSPYAKGEKWPASIKRLWESREHKVIVWLSIAIIALRIKEQLLEERSFSTTTGVGISVIFFLAALDLIADVIRAKLKKALV